MPSFCSDSLATEHDTCTSLACKGLTNITNCLASLGRAWDWAWAWAEAAALELGHINYNKSYSCCALAERQRQRRPTVDCPQCKPNQTKFQISEESRANGRRRGHFVDSSDGSAIAEPLNCHCQGNKWRDLQHLDHSGSTDYLYLLLFFFELMVGVKPRHSLKLLCRPSQRKSNSQDYQLRNYLSSSPARSLCSLFFGEHYGN